ncbi:hypothetical protein D9M73_133090 [compost metagenome]
MRRINQQRDAFSADEGSQAFSATIAADAHLARKVGRHAADTGQAINVPRAQGAGDGQGFGDATEQ